MESRAFEFLRVNRGEILRFSHLNERSSREPLLQAAAIGEA